MHKSVCISKLSEMVVYQGGTVNTQSLVRIFLDNLGYTGTLTIRNDHDRDLASMKEINLICILGNNEKVNPDFKFHKCANCGISFVKIEVRITGNSQSLYLYNRPKPARFCSRVCVNKFRWINGVYSRPTFFSQKKLMSNRRNVILCNILLDNHPEIRRRIAMMGALATLKACRPIVHRKHFHRSKQEVSCCERLSGQYGEENIVCNQLLTGGNGRWCEIDFLVLRDGKPRKIIEYHPWDIKGRSTEEYESDRRRLIESSNMAGVDLEVITGIEKGVGK